MAFAPAPAPVKRDLEIAVPPGADGFSALAWAPTSNHLAVTSWDNKVRVWEIQRGAGNAPVGGVGKLEFDSGAPLLDLAWKEDGQHVFLGGCAKTVKLWSLATNTATDVGSVRRALAAGRDVREAKLTRPPILLQHDAPIKGVGWAAEKQFLVTGSWDKSLRYWDPRSPATPVLALPMPECVVPPPRSVPL